MKKYHFVGIKGSGMSSLAQILHDAGFSVQGSDVDHYYFTQKPLEEKGIPFFPFDEQNITTDLVIIYSNAYNDSHPEIKKARELGLEIFAYHDFLGYFANQYKSIGISGAHGKTSTTALLAHVLKGIQPTSYLIGDGTGEGVPNSTYFVFESCEYRRHFLSYKPDYSIITNIDFDHPDYFKDEADVVDAFESFSNQTKKRVIAFGDDANVRKLSSASILYYGLSSDNELRATNIRVEEGQMLFDVYYQDQFIDTFERNVFGTHHVLNALSIIAICIIENLSLPQAKERMKSFGGAKRRFSEKTCGTNILVDDYAHHPTEIKATIESARLKYPDRNVIAVFQPHTFTRTEKFLHEFASALSQADSVYLCDIFSSAREKGGSLTIHDMISLVDGAEHVKEETISKLLVHENAVLLFMGAGDIQKMQQAYEKAANVTC